MIDFRTQLLYQIAVPTTTERRGATKGQAQGVFCTRMPARAPAKEQKALSDSTPSEFAGKVASIAVYGIFRSIQHLFAADTRSQGFRSKGGDYGLRSRCIDRRA